MGGGPSSEQRAAAASQAALSDKLGQAAQDMQKREASQYALIKPYATSRLTNGLPFYGDMTDFAGPTTTRAYAPARASLVRSMSRFGSLPSGYRTAALADFDANKARAFDAALYGDMGANEQAKSEAARLITGQQQIANPIPYYSTAAGANQSIMNAPLQSAGLMGLLGGAAAGAASAIPF